MRDDIKNILNSEKDLTIKKRTDLDGKIQTINYFNCLVDDINTFDERSKAKKKGYHNPNFPSISEGLEGWESGLYLFAAESNAGKTMLMTNILEDLCMYKDNNLFGVYYSLDDDKNKVIPRIIAMRERIPIGVVAKPLRYKEMVLEGHPDAQNIDSMLQKREVGLLKLKTDASQLMIRDSKDIKSLEDLEESISQIQNFVKTLNPEANIVVAIDSLKDIQTSVMMEANAKSEYVSKSVKDWAVTYDIIIMASMHLRKLNGNRRPTLDDLKSDNTVRYESSMIWLLHNDVSVNKQAAKIYSRSNDEDAEKQPIIEIDWAKNKVSTYKGRSFCYFSPEYSKAVECGEEASARFNALLCEA